RRNAERFPEDFAYQLTQQEVTSLISQIVISKTSRGGRRKRPWAFTEHGVAMLSSVLRSPTAVRVNIEIMRAFVRIRRLMATPGELVEQLTRLAETVQLHDEQIKTIVQVIGKLTERPEEPKRRIGFHSGEEE
ncbi:MAG: ORF6N domain-containing protein, partial [Thermoguttaceae bacterium]